MCVSSHSPLPTKARPCHIHTCVHAHTHMCTDTCVRPTPMHVCAPMHVYMHTCPPRTHRHMHTHEHTHTRPTCTLLLTTQHVWATLRLRLCVHTSPPTPGLGHPPMSVAPLVLGSREGGGKQLQGCVWSNGSCPTETPSSSPGPLPSQRGPFTRGGPHPWKQ